MTLDEVIERYTRNAEYERTHGNLQGCLEFRQLSEWLKDYKRLLEQEPKMGHCEECKHFRKLPYHADALGKCMQHTGFCPKGDWYCADYEPEKGAIRNE